MFSGLDREHGPGRKKTAFIFFKQQVVKLFSAELGAGPHLRRGDVAAKPATPRNRNRIRTARGRCCSTPPAPVPVAVAAEDRPPGCSSPNGPKLAADGRGNAS